MIWIVWHLTKLKIKRSLYAQNKTVLKFFQLQFFEVLFLLFLFLCAQQDLLRKQNLEKAKTEPQKIAVERTSKPFYFAQTTTVSFCILLPGFFPYLDQRQRAAAGGGLNRRVLEDFLAVLLE